MQRYFFATDNDSHWYLVPAARRQEWEAWANLSEDDERAWEAPEYAKRVPGPYSFTFTDPVDAGAPR